MIRELWRRVKCQIGRRGAFLSFLALLDLAYGYSLLTTPPVPKYDLLLPWAVWGVVWIGAGVVALSGIFAKKDWPQYTVCATVKATWAALWAHLWLVQHIPRTWVSVLVWAAFSLTVMLIGGWPEPEAPRPSRDLL